MKSKGGRSGKKDVSSQRRTERPRKGYRWLKSWMQEHLAEEGARGEDEGKELLNEIGADELVRWLPRLFWESSAGDRKGILRSLVPLAGSKGIPLLEDVVGSPRSRLLEKEIASEQLKGWGQARDVASEECLEKAVGFVDVLSEWVYRKETTDEVPEEVLHRFYDLLPPYQGVVLREVLDRFPEGVFPFLECVLVGQSDLWEEILEGLAEAPQEEAARLLQVGHQRAEKSLQKKIRRVHHKRSVRGLPVLPLEREETEGAIWRPPVPPKPTGLISMPEPSGTRMVWVFRPNVRKGMLVFGGWVDDERGLLKFFVMDPSRKEAEKYEASLLQNPEFTVVEGEAGFCAWLLEEAYRKGPPVDFEEAEAYKAIRPLLKEVVPTERPPAPVYTVFFDSPDEPVLEDPLGESASLLNEDLLRNWVIEAERIQPHVEQLEEIEGSRIIVHPLQKKERMEAFYHEVTGEILSDATCRTSWRRRLEDAAWVFYKKGLEGQARRLAHMGRYLEDPAKDGSRISFFIELVRRGLEQRLQEKRTEEKQQPSLIVKPS